MVMAAHHKIIHPLWIRLCHWVNFIALTIMLLSGWRIYNASPIFSFSFPKQITLGNWLGGALLWHFAFMWLFFLNGLIYLLTNILTGRLMKKFFPLRRQDLINDIMATLKAKLDHGTLATYNTIQKLAYLFIICDLILLVLSGLVLWKSVQFPLLRELLGGYDNARMVHFCAMVAMLGFFIIHVTMVALVPRTLIMMMRGR